MSKLLDVISLNYINNLMEDIIENINDYDNVELNYDYFDLDISSLKSKNNIGKKEMSIYFHEALKVISQIIFNNYLNKMGYDKCIDNEYLENKESYIEIDNKIQLLDKCQLIYALKYLYTDIVGLVERKKSGTEFTPQEIVEFMYEAIGYKGEIVLKSKLFEPSCGSGIFVVEAIKRVISQIGCKDKKYIKKLLLEDNIVKAIDINPVNIIVTRYLIICTLIENGIELEKSDIIEFIQLLPIHLENALDVNENEKYDFIVGNPPYIRLQNLDLDYRNFIKDNFRSATGRFDLYVCFIEKCIKLLKDNGTISLITSNKYFTANYGKGIRSFIKENLDVEFIFDLNDTKFFEASVLPAIIQGKKNTNIQDDEFEYFSIKENNNIDISFEEQNIFEVILELLNSKEEMKDNFKIDINGKVVNIEFIASIEKICNKKDQWNFGSKQYNDIKKFIESQEVDLLENIADVCVGVKTTADTVFVKPMSYNFIKEMNFENELIYPLIQSDNVERWNINWIESKKNSGYILYPHIVNGNKMVAADLDKYPNIKNYVYDNEAILKARTYLMESNTRMWYECWVPQHLNKFRKPKIVTRDIVSENCFAIDYQGRICQGNTFFITLKNTDNLYGLSEEEYLKFLLGILNSEIMEFYHKTISGSLYSKKFRYTTSNLNRWNIPIIKKENIESVNIIISLVEYNINNSSDNIKIKENEDKINNIVYKLYNVNLDMQSDIKAFIKVNS